jgi:16S rRNA processing protein RimM
LIEAGELVIGIVRGPIGIEGDAAVASCSGETAHFRGIERIDAVLPDGKRAVLTVTRIEEDSKGLLMRFSGYDTPEKIVKLSGTQLVVPREKAAPLRKGQFYAIDLVGCALMLDGSKVARVLSLIEGGSYDFLELALPDGRTVCVPFLKEFIGDVDLKAKTIELRKAWIIE